MNFWFPTTRGKEWKRYRWVAHGWSGITFGKRASSTRFSSVQLGQCQVASPNLKSGAPKQDFLMIFKISLIFIYLHYVHYVHYGFVQEIGWSASDHPCDSPASKASVTPSLRRRSSSSMASTCRMAESLQATLGAQSWKKMKKKHLSNLHFKCQNMIETSKP